MDQVLDRERRIPRGPRDPFINDSTSVQTRGEGQGLASHERPRHTAMPVKHWIVRTAALAVAATASWHCARLAWADREFRKLTRDSLHHAVQWDPGNTRYLLTLAQLEEPAPLLATAAALSAYDAGVRVRLGLHAEAAGDYAQAERWLLEAARLSRRYEPRWTLANFYFRRDNPTEFWRWAREALAVSYGDRTPLFDLCAAMEPSTRAKQNRDREGADAQTPSLAALPVRRDVRLAYALWAEQRGRIEEAAPLVMELAAGAPATERPALLRLCERLVAAYRIADALAVWKKLAPQEPPFEWHAAESRGVGVYPRSSGGWSVSLDGSQPEQVELLWKVAPVSGGRCRLTVQQSGDSTGLRWTVRKHAPGGAELDTEFVAPPDLSAVRVALRYERPAGSMRREAAIEIERAGVRCQP